MRSAAYIDGRLREAAAVHLDRSFRVGALLGLTFGLALWAGNPELRGAVLLGAVRMLQDQPAPAEAGVRETLQRYSAALESLDASAVKKIQPSIPVDNLAKAFKDMRELKVTIDAVRVLSIDGATARVSCRVTQTLTPRAGSKQITTVTRVMRLKRNVEAWIIDGFER
jgi:hypothetical protein